MKIKKGTEKEYAVFRAERTLEPDYRATLLYMEAGQKPWSGSWNGAQPWRKPC